MNSIVKSGKNTLAGIGVFDAEADGLRMCGRFEYFVSRLYLFFPTDSSLSAILTFAESSEKRDLDIISETHIMV